MMKIKEFAKNHTTTFIGIVVSVIVSITAVDIYAATPTYTVYEMKDTYGHTLPMFYVRKTNMSNDYTVKMPNGGYQDMNQMELDIFAKKVEGSYKGLFSDTYMTSQKVEEWQ